MKEFVLPKTGGVATVDVMNEGDLPEVLALHELTRAALPSDKKTFILPHDVAYFQDFLRHKNGGMIGIRTENRLIAQMVLMGPLSLRDAIASRALTRNDVPFHHASLNDQVVLIKSLASLPSCRGNDLAKNLVLAALDHPLTHMVAHVFTQISVGNKRSWDSFARLNFGIVSAAYDPGDNMPRFIFQRPTFGFDLEPHIMADDVDPAQDFQAIVSLTQREGLIGLYEEGSTDKLAFLRNREETVLMPTTVARIG